MKKQILIYGGCHAQIIRHLLSKILAPEEFELSLLVNFWLIGAGEPFPYADLNRYDAVIYSPIENHGDYNTDKLRDICAKIGCQSICFPWLEWHGYCVGAQKGVFKGRHQWYYPGLQVLAEKFSNFDMFYDCAIDTFPDDPTIDRIFNASSDMIRAAEKKHEMDVQISDFILRNYQAERLFFISDHASLKVYNEIIAQILVALKLPPHGVFEIEEPQGEQRTPIFPRLARKIGLEFSDSDWVDDELMPGKSWDLRTYLRLYFYPNAAIYGPLENAGIFHQGASGLSATRMQPPPETKLYARPGPRTEGSTLENYELLEVLNGPANMMDALRKFAINPNEWRSTWTL